MPLMRDTSLEHQFRELLKKNRNRHNDKAIAVVKQMLPVWSDELIREASGFNHVTGNTMNGFFVGAYMPFNGAMQLVGAAFSSDKVEEPTRPTLKKGEMYDLDVYWRGRPVVGKPFVGIFGTRNFLSFDESMRFLQSHAPRLSPLGFLVGNSVNYAKFLEVHKKANLITKFADDRKREGVFIVTMHGR